MNIFEIIHQMLSDQATGLVVTTALSLYLANQSSQKNT